MISRVLGWYARLIVSLLLLTLCGNASADEVIRYVHTDALGSPVAYSDANGVVLERVAYEPYGERLNDGASGHLGYAGHVSDSLTGLTYMQQRYYDPAIGSFLSVDPIAALSSPIESFSRYRYANSNPFRFLDPDGRKGVDASGLGSLGCMSDVFCRFALDDGAPRKKGYVSSMMKRHRTPTSQAELMNSVGVDPELYQYVRSTHEEFVTAVITSLAGAGGKGVVTAAEGAASRMAQSRMAAKVLTEAGEVRFSATAAGRAAGRDYAGPLAIRETIRYGSRAPDPQGVPGRFMYTLGASYKGGSGKFEVLVNEVDRVVEHVVYKKVP